MKPQNLEMKLLKKLCLGSVEDRRSLVGIGPKTIESAIQKGWVIEDICEYYSIEGLRITDLGSSVLQEHSW